MRLFPLVCILPALCALTANGMGLDPALQEARLDLMAGDRVGAARMYAFWLEANSDSSQAPAVFDRYFSTEQDLPTLLEEGRKFLQTAKRGVNLSESLARIARLFEIAGKTEEARDAFLSAFVHGETLSSLEAAFLISLEMNDVDELQSALATTKNGENERLEFLQACLAFQMGEYGSANASLTRVADTVSDESIALKALWLGYEIAIRSGDSAARQEALMRLQSRFPSSPEYALAAADNSTADPRGSISVTLLASPGTFFSEGSNLPQTGSSAANQNTSVAAQKGLTVQAGSFQMKENADDLIAELTSKGFSPTLRTDTQQGRSLYRVLAGSGLAATDARVLVDKLHQAGFSGFLLRDQD
jgi:hypothetical protein